MNVKMARNRFIIDFISVISSNSSDYINIIGFRLIRAYCLQVILHFLTKLTILIQNCASIYKYGKQCRKC